MLTPLETFFEYYEEPTRGCLLALRDLIQAFDDDLVEHYKYRVPYFYYRGKPFCYLYQDKKAAYPYIGIPRSDRFDHPALVQGDRKRMKVLPVNPEEDIPVEIIYEVLELAKALY